MNKVKLLCGDARQLIPLHTDGNIDLLFADPPFNMKKQYEMYDDNKTRDEYLLWTEDWLKLAFNALKPNGSMFLMSSDAFVSEIDIMCKRLGFYRKHYLFWHYGFGQYNPNGLTHSHIPMLHFLKDRNNYTLNKTDPRIRVASARLRQYNDKRANKLGRMPNNVWITDPKNHPEVFTHDSDSWEFSRIAGTFAERCKISPNQLPVALLERIILLFSNKGDLVVDPFMGTGTAAQVCVMEDRNYIGMDLSRKLAIAVKARVKETLIHKQVKEANACAQGELFSDPQPAARK